MSIFDGYCNGYMSGFFTDYLAGEGASGKIFHVDLRKSIIPIVGSSIPTFTRATGATFIDHESLLKTVEPGEGRFAGARRVRNLFCYTDDFSQSCWQKVGATVTGTNVINFPSVGNLISQQVDATKDPDGKKYTFRVFISGTDGQTITIRARNDPGDGTNEIFDKQVTLSSSGNTFSVSLEFVNLDHAEGPRFYIFRASGDTATQVTARFSQAEEVTGQTEQDPSEYVSVDSIISPYYGAGIDGSKFFTYLHANTVDGNGVVTEAQGADISESTLKGILIEKGAVQNLIYDSPTVAQVQSKSGISDVSVDWLGSFTNAIRFVDNASLRFGYMIYSGYQADTDYCLSVFVKMDDNSAPSVGTSSITGDFALIMYGAIVTSGIEVDHIKDNIYRVRAVKNSGSLSVGNFGIIKYTTQSSKGFNETGINVQETSFCMSHIKSTGSAESKDPDNLSYDSSAINGTDFTIVLKGFTPRANGADYADAEVRMFGTNDSGGTADEVRTIGDTAYGYTHGTGGGEFGVKKSDLVAGTAANFAFSLSQEGSNVRAIIYRNGTEVLNTTTAGTLDHSNSGLEVGHWAADVMSCNIKDIGTYPRVLTDTEFQTETTL